MERLHDVVANTRELLCVGREAELAALDDWLLTSEAPTCVFSVTGMGGIGKSTLLSQMVHRARQHDVADVWIDGRACGRSPAGFIAYLNTVSEFCGPTHEAAVATHEHEPGRRRPGLSPSDMEAVRMAPEGVGFTSLVPARMDVLLGSGRRMIWCIDHYEELESIDAWLRERFFAQFPTKGHLIVLASRHECDGWRNDPGWRDRFQWFPLPPLTRRESQVYLQRLGVSDDFIEQLVRNAAGLPLALALAADAFARRADVPGDVGRKAVHKVSARLLSEAAGEDLEPFLDLLAVVPEVDAPLFADVFGEPLSRARFTSLTNLSFVRTTRLGISLHDVARQHLLAELRHRDPARFARIRRLAVESLCRRLETASPGQHVSIAASLLSACADVLPSVESYAELSGPAPLGIRTVRTDDLPALHRFMDDWGSQPVLFDHPASYHLLLDRLAAEFPETCRVIQKSTGEPLAFIGVLLLCQDTVQLLDSVEQGALSRRLPHEHARLAALPPEQADTYICAIVGIDQRSEEYTLQELVGLIIREGLAYLGEGTRAFVGGSDANFERQLQHLGFTPTDHGLDAGRFMYVLDLRHGRFGPWVLSFLADDGSSSVSVGDPHPGTLSIQRLRELLSAFHDETVWERSGAALGLGYTGAQLKVRIVNALRGCQPLPAPFSQNDREILLRTYVQGQSPRAVADALHVSRATYYRHLQRAVERLRIALLNEVLS